MKKKFSANDFRAMVAKPAQKGTPLQRWQALGRMPDQGMNNTEKAYAAYLEGLKAGGLVLWYEFEPMNLRIGVKCFYRVDFMVMRPDFALEAHEVKGRWTDDARVKIRAAAAKFPFKFIGAQHIKGQWVFEHF